MIPRVWQGYPAARGRSLQGRAQGSSGRRREEGSEIELQTFYWYTCRWRFSGDLGLRSHTLASEDSDFRLDNPDRIRVRRVLVPEIVDGEGSTTRL